MTTEKDKIIEEVIKQQEKEVAEISELGKVVIRQVCQKALQSQKQKIIEEIERFRNKVLCIKFFSQDDIDLFNCYFEELLKILGEK
jgi:NAD-dependent DNA ligase